MRSPSEREVFLGKPKISEKTAKLAENKRRKLLGNRGNASLVEILLIPKNNEAALVQKRKQLEEKEVEGCTFAPKTLNYHSTVQRETHGDKCLDLYASKPKGWAREKGLKTRDDYEYDKHKEELTFRPMINDASY